MQWSTDVDIDSHEVRFKLESIEEPEQIITAKATKKVVYHCQHESMQYLVDVRSRNSLGRYGAWSDPFPVSLGKLQYHAQTW